MKDPGTESKAPELTGDSLAAVKHRGSHLQIIAGAGSGKTEVVAQRVVDLLADGFPAESIVAFTFTERAAAELKARIVSRVEKRLGREALDRLTRLFVGTIHAYCFRLLQERVPRYESYDVLDDNRLTAFLTREANRLKLKQLDPQNKLFASVARFATGVQVIENELLEPNEMPEPFRSILHDYYETLDRYRLLTYGQQIARAVEELEREELADQVHSELRHLIVDEYQDVNPAQERLIELLAGPEVELCVVGDDQQAIYQWRGSDVGNILEFPERYDGVATFEIDINRRSRPQLIETANRFAESIPERIEKEMGTFRETVGEEPEVVLWSAASEVAEAGWIAQLILDLNEQGVPFGDMAVLVRTSAAYPQLVKQFGAFDIPVQPGGRTGLFEQPEAVVLGKTYAWLTDVDWRKPREPGGPIRKRDLLEEYVQVFDLDPEVRREVKSFLAGWKESVPKSSRTADLVDELYSLLGILRIRDWDLDDPIRLNRTGTIARFSSLLADYEAARRRSRPDPENTGEQVGGQDRGEWYYRNLALHIVNYAQGAYEDFDGEADFELDAVDLTTIHRAKGLEWPAVFLPSLTAKRFPSTKTGQTRDWLVPRGMFNAERYEGSDGDERRLFYVGMTRARDWLSVSRHEKVTSQRTKSSPYYQELIAHETKPEEVTLPTFEIRSGDSDYPISLSFSELALFVDCGLAFRFRQLIGFEPRIAPELGYGKAVHHVMRTIAEATRQTGKAPTPEEIERLLEEGFYLPYANKPAHRNLKDAARRLALTYLEKHEDDLHRVWETERPFELHLDGVTVSGRADVILDEEEGETAALAIVDYKTSTDGGPLDHALQLQIYTDAGRKEGLDVRGAYVHDLKAGSRNPVPVDSEAVGEAEGTVVDAAVSIRGRQYGASPGERCRRCEVRTICPNAKP